MTEQGDEQLGFAPHAPLDGRKEGDWKTRYPKEANMIILGEAIYLGFIFFLIPILSLLIYNDFNGSYIINQPVKKFAFAWLGGTFGGTLFDLKWLYHSIAKNMWNEDRRWWRYFTPHISGGLSFVVAVLISSNMINVFSPEVLNKPSSVFGLGFLTGYFSDSAIGKLTEVANTFFGSTEKHSTSTKK